MGQRAVVQPHVRQDGWDGQPQAYSQQLEYGSCEQRRDVLHEGEAELVGGEELEPAEPQLGGRAVQEQRAAGPQHALDLSDGPGQAGGQAGGDRHSIGEVSS
mgnify:CR=1 FL=1